MATVLLIRHGRTTANARGILAGWGPGADLDETGRAQAEALGRRLSGLALAALVTSPLARCRATAAAIGTVPGPGTSPGGESCARPEPVVDDRLGECHYGSWEGRRLADLVGDPLWRVVQSHPSAARFPGPRGESLSDLAHRAVAAVRDHDAQVSAAHGDQTVWAAVTHGDVVKAVLADALGMHLDAFQRLVVDPGSVSVVTYTTLRPFVLGTNDLGGDLTRLCPKPSAGPGPTSSATPGFSPSDAVVGGSLGA
jgi:probable phosphomutase (TIGR03848 family)